LKYLDKWRRRRDSNSLPLASVSLDSRRGEGTGGRSGWSRKTPSLFTGGTGGSNPLRSTSESVLVGKSCAGAADAFQPLQIGPPSKIHVHPTVSISTRRRTISGRCADAKGPEAAPPVAAPPVLLRKSGESQHVIRAYQDIATASDMLNR
jgi:hypothetical protein